MSEYTLFGDNTTNLAESEIIPAAGFNAGTGLMEALIESANMDMKLYEAMMKVDALELKYRREGTLNESNMQVFRENTGARIAKALNKAMDWLIKKLEAFRVTFVTVMKKYFGKHGKLRNMARKHRHNNKEKTDEITVKWTKFKKDPVLNFSDVPGILDMRDIKADSSEADACAHVLNKCFGINGGSDDVAAAVRAHVRAEYLGDATATKTKVSEIPELNDGGADYSAKCEHAISVFDKNMKQYLSKLKKYSVSTGVDTASETTGAIGTGTMAAIQVYKTAVPAYFDEIKKLAVERASEVNAAMTKIAGTGANVEESVLNLMVEAAYNELSEDLTSVYTEGAEKKEAKEAGTEKGKSAAEAVNKAGDAVKDAAKGAVDAVKGAAGKAADAAGDAKDAAEDTAKKAGKGLKGVKDAIVKRLKAAWAKLRAAAVRVYLAIQRKIKGDSEFINKYAPMLKKNADKCNDVKVSVLGAEAFNNAIGIEKKYIAAIMNSNFDAFTSITEEANKIGKVTMTETTIGQLGGIESVLNQLTDESNVIKGLKDVEANFKKADAKADTMKAGMTEEQATACITCGRTVNLINIRCATAKYKGLKAAVIKAIGAVKTVKHETVQLMVEAAMDEIDDVIVQAINSKNAQGIEDVNHASTHVLDGGESTDPNALDYEDTNCYSQDKPMGSEKVAGTVDAEIGKDIKMSVTRGTQVESALEAFLRDLDETA